jgi:hypothetical protein
MQGSFTDNANDLWHLEEEETGKDCVRPNDILNCHSYITSVLDE